MDEELLKAIRTLLQASERARRAGVELAPEDQEAFVREETGGKYGLNDAQRVIASIDTEPGLRNLGRSAAQGALFNFADELMGAIQGPAAKEEMRLRDELFSGANPKTAIAANVVGGLAVPGLGAGAAATKAGASLGARAVAGMGAGAIAGGLSGAGAAETMADVPEAAALGAGGGAVVGGAIPGISGAVRSAFSPVLRGARRLQDAVARSGGVDAVRVANRAAEGAGRGEQVMLGDLSDQLRSATDFAATNDDATLTKLVPVLRDRQSDASERILGDVRSEVGDPLASQRIEQLAEARRAWADEAYGSLREAYPQIPVTPRLDEVLRRPVVRAALARAKEDGLVGDMPDMGNPSVAHLLDVRKALRSRESVAFAQGNGTLGSGIREARKAIEDELSEAVPGWKAVNDQYAQLKGLEQAVADGVTWFNTKDSRGLREYLKGLSAGELEEFRLGMASEMISTLRSAKTNRDVAKELMDASPAMQDKLRVVFGSEEAFKRFMTRTDVEAQLARLKGAIGGSPTARRLSAMGYDPAELGIDLVTNPAAAGGKLTAAAARLGKGAMNRRTAAALGPYLTTQGSQNIERLLSAFATDRPVVGPVLSGALPASLGGLFGSTR